AEAVARPRFTAIVTSIFAVSAAALAAMGVFGVMAYTVSLRREELAVRLALGATPRGLRHHVLGQAARLAAIGIVAGLLSACGCCDRSAACCTASRRAIPSRCQSRRRRWERWRCSPHSFPPGARARLTRWRCCGDSELPVTSYQLPVASYPLPVTRSP